MSAANKTQRCCFGSLAENRCEKDAEWLTRSGSAYCDEHKPTWTRDLAYIGPDKKIFVAPGRIFNTSGCPASNPRWSKERSFV